MVNATIERFGHPATLVAETAHWMVLLRPQAVTLGSLILAAKGNATAYGDLPAAAFTDQGLLLRRIEATLTTFVGYEKINYLMLMMVDPHVHFHVIPRYAEPRSFEGVDYPDIGWPGIPDLSCARKLEAGEIARMVSALGTCRLE